MTSLSEHQLLLVLPALATILVVGRTFGEIARRLGQPEVLGELCAGFVLGPSVIGAIAPAAHRALFLDPAVGLVLSAFSWIGAILLLVLAGTWDAELVLLHAVLSESAQLRWHERDQARLWRAAHGVVEEAAFRARRLGVRVDRRVRAGRHPGQEIVRELQRDRYDLVVVGCYDHGPRGRMYLGTTVEALVTQSRTPAALLVSRGAPSEIGI